VISRACDSWLIFLCLDQRSALTTPSQITEQAGSMHMPYRGCRLVISRVPVLSRSN
jgi:hypothetical protein